MHSRCIGNDGKPVFASIMCRGRQKLYSEINDHPFAVAVQWHPEMMYDSSEQLKLLRAFVEAAGLKKIYYEKTEELGQLMGKRGHGLVFGGGKEGLMGAAARGVDREKGYILGIAPRFFDQPGVLYEHCTEFIFTENMRERKHLLESRSDATIVVPGGIGTYEEFFEILTLKSLGRIDRPIVLYNIQGYYDSMQALLEYTAGEKFMSRDVVGMCRFMKDPEEILDYIENYRNYGGRL